MASFMIFWAFLLLASACVSAKLVEHTFQAQTVVLKRLCKNQTTLAVNGRVPGPTIYVHEGDTVSVHVLNKSPYDVTIHWHGVYMMLNGWADGPNYITQCPIGPGDSYTYKFNITKQEGTLWWHAHASWIRATVYGAFIIYPKAGQSYPFKQPHKEFPILLGEWWNANMIDVENKYFKDSLLYYLADAFTINGQPGDFYECPSNNIYKLKVKQGKTYLLRIINVGLNHIFFFKIANHKMTVVAVDAGYTNPYVTDVVTIASGQTTDVLLEADQPPRSYYMAAGPYISVDPNTSHANINTSGIVVYEGATSSSSKLPIQTRLPDFFDTSVAYNFFSNLTSLTTGSFWVPVPHPVDEHIFMTAGLGIVPCDEVRNKTCGGPFGQLIFGSMNNISFQLPTKMSILEAFYNNIGGIYTTDFPKEPPLKFDYTNPSNQFNRDLIWIKERATKVKKLKYNSTVEIVLQNTVLAMKENHPIHLHGYDFHVLAQGFGNYDATRDERSFNLVNPQRRNTVAVPAGGWVVIRFQANNPGVWLMHCHLELHVSSGLATAFIVENGPTPSTSLPPPPLDFPKCNNFKTNIPSTGQLGVGLPSEKSIELTSSV